MILSDELHDARRGAVIERRWAGADEALLEEARRMVEHARVFARAQASRANLGATKDALRALDGLLGDAIADSIAPLMRRVGDRAA